MIHTGLGIDTGGTYTDAVLYDYEAEKVLSYAKSLTTKEDLTIGISNVFDKLDAQIMEKIDLVSLSTTLATNACVENKGGKVKLILFGCDRALVENFKSLYGMPAMDDISFIDAEITLHGDIAREPDWNAFEKTAESFKNNYDAFAVVAYWGARNPSFEIRAKELILNMCAKPVVCGHELSSQLNFMKRSVSAVLNAKLMPVISSFISAIKQIMHTRGIDAPIVIVRSDASIMTAEFAMQKPVETLLSGPAASVIGGTFLNEQKDALIVDMGGTTTDIAVVRDNEAVLTEEGAVVGGFKTAVKSLSIKTVGLGGDSKVECSFNGEVSLDARRVRPLCDLAEAFPEVGRQLMRTPDDYNFYYITDDAADISGMNEREKLVYEVLQKMRVISVGKCGDLFGSAFKHRYQAQIVLRDLENRGILMAGSLTPTDVMHIRGDYRTWDSAPAAAVIDHLAAKFQITPAMFCENVYTAVKQKLYTAVAEMLIENDTDHYFTQNEINLYLPRMISASYQKYINNQTNSILNYGFHSNIPLIGVGAPIHIFLPDVAKALGTGSVINRYAAVANAVGALKCKISVKEEVRIRPGNNVRVFVSSGSMLFGGFSEALAFARKEAVRLAEAAATQRGAKRLQTRLIENENSLLLGEQSNMFVEYVVTAVCECGINDML